MQLQQFIGFWYEQLFISDQQQSWKYQFYALCAILWEAQN